MKPQRFCEQNPICKGMESISYTVQPIPPNYSQISCNDGLVDSMPLQIESQEKCITNNQSILFNHAYILLKVFAILLRNSSAYDCKEIASII